jgi:hypothetical protein
LLMQILSFWANTVNHGQDDQNMLDEATLGSILQRVLEKSDRY